MLILSCLKTEITSSIVVALIYIQFSGTETNRNTVFVMVRDILGVYGVSRSNARCLFAILDRSKEYLQFKVKAQFEIFNFVFLYLQIFNSVE